MGKQGFTLVELIVCIAVLSILAGIGVPYMMGYRNRAAAGVNEVNLLTTARQINMVRNVFEAELKTESWRTGIAAEKEILKLGSWDFAAPSAQGVTSGERKVEAGTAMKAWLEEGQGKTTYWETGAAALPEEETAAPAETAPEETDAPATEPTVPAHACRDRDGDCLCDIDGCGAAMHTDKEWVNDGICSKCGIHFLHRGVADEVCDTCGMDLATGLTHVCVWEEGVCRCKCGNTRCDHGCSGTGRCPICAEKNTWIDRCPNCNGG